MPYTATFAIPKYVIFILVFFVSINLPAQFFNDHSSSIWLKPVDNPDTSKQLPVIGNYQALELDSLNLFQLKKVAKKDKGTLFLVIGTEDTLIDRPFIQLGRTEISAQEASLGGIKVGLDHNMAKKPCMVRLSYNYLGSSYYIPPIVKIDSTVFIAECIYFEDKLSSKEIRTVETYLALKYSINITANKDPNLRDYISGGGKKLWNTLSDYRFDTEVMAIGRVDSLSWLQTQTYTVDGKNIQISLDSLDLPRLMPDVVLPDKALMVLSKSRQTPPESSVCGALQGERLWKIRTENWIPTGGFLYITLEQSLQEMNYPILSNGVNHLALDVKVIGDQSKIKLPLLPALATNEYFIFWGQSALQSHLGCNPFCHVTAPPCLDQLGGLGQIDIEIDPRGLPAQIELYNLDTDETFQETVYQSFSSISGLSQGQYQLSVVGKEINLADELFVVGNCTSDITGEETALVDNGISNQNGVHDDWRGNFNKDVVSQPSANFKLTEKSFAKGIQAFPNPSRENEEVKFVFRGLNAQTFQVSVFDSHGKLINKRSIVPTEEKSYITQRFTVPAVYTVRFTSEKHSELIKIVVN